MAGGVLAVAKLGNGRGPPLSPALAGRRRFDTDPGIDLVHTRFPQPVTTKIAAQKVTEGAKDAKPAAGPKTDGAATAAPGQPATASGEKPAGPNPGETATARSDAPPPTDKPSPAPAAERCPSSPRRRTASRERARASATPASPPGQSTPTLLGGARCLTRPLRHSLPSSRTIRMGWRRPSRLPRRAHPRSPQLAGPRHRLDATRDQARARGRPQQIGSACGFKASLSRTGQRNISTCRAWRDHDARKKAAGRFTV